MDNVYKCYKCGKEFEGWGNDPCPVVMDEDAKSVKTINGFENGLDIAKYANENIYMFSGDSVNALINIGNEYSTTYVPDWFGDGAKIYKDKNGKIYARIQASELALIYWCLQYGENIELIEPKTTRAKIKEI